MFPSMTAISLLHLPVRDKHDVTKHSNRKELTRAAMVKQSLCELAWSAAD